MDVNKSFGEPPGFGQYPADLPKMSKTVENAKLSELTEFDEKTTTSPQLRDLNERIATVANIIFKAEVREDVAAVKTNKEIEEKQEPEEDAIAARINREIEERQEPEEAATERALERKEANEDLKNANIQKNRAEKKS